MPFVKPQLAKPLKDALPDPQNWIAEEKYDGHRLIVSVGDGTARTLFDEVGVRAWSRDAKDRILPARVREALRSLPAGTYDGELLAPGERSYGVTVLGNVDLLVYVIFDVIHLLGRDLTSTGIAATYDERRAALEEVAHARGIPENDFTQVTDPVQIAWNSVADGSDALCSTVQRLSEEVWSRDGEGLILKRRKSLYEVGKRTKDWLKVKKVLSSVLTVIGFTAGTMGVHSIVVLRDDEGNETSVKWKNLEELAAIEADPKSRIGRRLRIEYQERTPDGGYRHPRWDRWEDE